MNFQKLFESVFVGLGRLDQAVDAECRNDAHCCKDDKLDKLAHKILLGDFFIKIFVFCQKVK